TPSIARAVRLGNALTAAPRLLAMLCILAVFVPAFFMHGAARGLFAPLALAVAFAMIASYILSSTFVPVASVWLLRHTKPRPVVAVPGRPVPPDRAFEGLRSHYEAFQSQLIRLRYLLIPAYLTACVLIIIAIFPRLGREIFPQTDTGAF